MFLPGALLSWLPVITTLRINVVWFQKLSIPPHWREVFLSPPPPPPLWKFQSSFIPLLIFLGLWDPPSPLQEFPIPSVREVWIFSGTRRFGFFFSTMFTASTDKTLGIWDFETGARIKKLKGHNSFVNSCFPSRRGPQYIVSGADDCTVKVCLVERSL